MDGIGAHEVIIDTPLHSLDLSDLPTAALAEVLRMIGDRVRALEAEGWSAYVQVFKNKGEASGASIVHPHTQIVATPLIPGQVRDEIRAAERAFKRDHRCLFCRLIEEETSADERLVRRSDRFAAIAPFASRFPYEVHILPLLHAPNFSSLNGGEGIDLADMLRAILGRMKAAFSDPPYNLVLHQGARPDFSATRGILLPGVFHWHLEIFPVLTRAAGFEWGTGLFINPVPPEAAARFLRGEQELVQAEI
jgi:UDPglucose--hexose-1-phosphate uridylyltransferase